MQPVGPKAARPVPMFRAGPGVPQVVRAEAERAEPTEPVAMFQA